MYSSDVQPETDIVDWPSGTVPSGDAVFRFQGNQDLLTFTCRLDGGAPEPCAGEQRYTGLPDGPHTFSVAATDRWGVTDPTPAVRTWEVATGTGTPATEAGWTVRVRPVSGRVLVKLPSSSGFVRLEGVANVPAGSTLDTRRGRVAVTAAVAGRRRTARFRGGLLQIRQPGKRRNPVRVYLVSATGAKARCTAGRRRARVRTLSTTAGRAFRVVGAAATAAAAKGTATFVTTDRCDGTVTKVRRGRVAVTARKTGKRKTVKAGRGSLVRGARR